MTLANATTLTNNAASMLDVYNFDEQPTTDVKGLEVQSKAKGTKRKNSKSNEPSSLNRVKSPKVIEERPPKKSKIDATLTPLPIPPKSTLLPLLLQPFDARPQVEAAPSTNVVRKSRRITRGPAQLGPEFELFLNNSEQKRRKSLPVVVAPPRQLKNLDKSEKTSKARSPATSTETRKKSQKKAPPTTPTPILSQKAKVIETPTVSVRRKSLRSTTTVSLSKKQEDEGKGEWLPPKNGKRKKSYAEAVVAPKSDKGKAFCFLSSLLLIE